MRRGDELQQLRRLGTLDELERAFPHLWLLRELTEVPASALRTRPFDGVAVDQALADGKPLGMLFRFRCNPGRYALWPLAKRQGSPFPDRIFVGRTAHNDIVLPAESISKLHAIFDRGTEWTLSDAGSRNGTRVDGRALRPKDPVRVGDRTTIVFGDVPCELLATRSLFD